MKFLGRDEELASLKLLLQKQTSSIIAVRGRRRIGKSTLIREFCRRNELNFINIEGLPPREGQGNVHQLNNFVLKLARETGYECGLPDDWPTAFEALGRTISDSGWTVVLLDEISWMGKYDPDFSGHLKNAWDENWKHHEKLIVVICGSVSGWIKQNILDSAGFGGRFSRDIVLNELPLDLCVQFWGDRSAQLPPREMLDVLSVTGGVPRYLEEVLCGLSAEENIKRLFFHKDGPLFKEFDSLFNEVFGSTMLSKKAILKELSLGPKTCEEIAEALGVERGGGLSESLAELKLAGFVADDRGYNPETGKRARQGRYRLRDNYTRFYLRHVEPHEEEIRSGNYEPISLSMLPGWDSLLGYAFESLVVNNVRRLLPFLHLDGVPILSAVPFTKRGGKSAGEGYQIDLCIQTRKAVYVVEIKRQNEIGEEVEDQVAGICGKIKIGSDVALRRVLVYDGHLKDVVLGNRYFDAIVSSRELLGL